MLVILATWEAEIWRITVQGQFGQIVPETSISKITKAKWTGGVTKKVEHLLCKHKALSADSSVKYNTLENFIALKIKYIPLVHR
jgi:hypothetical protein